MDIEIYKGKGLTGLANLGNTCFVNSCIQVLSHTYELNNFLNKKTYKQKLNNVYDTALLIEWDSLRTLMWSENCIISPGKFIKTIQKLAQLKGVDIFTGFAQNDLPEFLLFVINSFHTSLSRHVNMDINGSAANSTDEMAVKCFEMIKNMYSKEYSEIWNMFYGIHISQIISLETGEVLSSAPEPYFMINLSLPPSDNKNPSLIDCFDLYVEGELLNGDNAWYNEKTQKKQEIQKKISYWSLPNILVIDIKRFNARNQKNQILVSFPLENLDLTKYVVGYKKESYIYDLYGICNHSGGVHGGHYTSYIKTAQEWVHYNDDQLNKMSADAVITPMAYCLFYKLRELV